MTQMNQLEAWLAQEREVMARLDAGVGAGVARPEQVAGKSGLETLQAMLRGELPYPPIAKTLDFSLLEVEEGRAVFQGTPGPAHLNPMGTIHGGWYATLLDSALGCAVHTMMPRRARLHHGRTGREPGACHRRQGATRARRGQGRPLRQATRDGASAAVWAGRHVVRARHDDLPGV